MGVGSLLQLVPALTGKLARVYIQPLNPDGSPEGGINGLGAKGLPYWPATISDSKGATWESKQIPGGSHPLYQWVSGTDRTISFSIVLTHETQEVDPQLEPDDVHNVDVQAAIAWLRGMTFPIYESDVAKPPPMLQLVMPGTGISGSDGIDDLLVIMTQCDVEYQKFFNDGTPRLATVSVSFLETVQYPGSGIGFYGRDFFYNSAAFFKMNPKPNK